MTIRLFLYIGIGGMIGTLARYSTSITFSEINGFPHATLVVNLIGCFLLSFILNYDKIKQRLSPEIRIALGTGVIGSFTTFSTFALETIELWNNNMLLALAYALLSVGGGLAFCYIGYKLANRGQRLDTV